VTDEDRKNAPMYLQILDGIAAGATFAELAWHVFGLRTLTDADRDVIKQYHARAVWMTEVGWRQIAGGDVGSVVTTGLFSSGSMAMLRLRDWESAVPDLMARKPFAAFVAQVAGAAASDRDWSRPEDEVLRRRVAASDETVVKRNYEKCLQAMAEHPDHPLWPSLVLMAYARLAKQTREKAQPREGEPAGLAFFMAVLRRAFKDRDAVKVATVTSTLAEPMQGHVVKSVVGDVRRLILDLLMAAPGDTLAVMLAPIR
jgi:hypothetical protein